MFVASTVEYVQLVSLRGVKVDLVTYPIVVWHRRIVSLGIEVNESTSQIFTEMSCAQSNA